MTTTKTVACPVEVEDSYGVYANSFRVMQDGPDILLDFCVYTAQENRARLTSRVRVSPEFLGVILSRLQQALEETPTNGAGSGLYVMPELEGEN